MKRLVAQSVCLSLSLILFGAWAGQKPGWAQLANTPSASPTQAGLQGLHQIGQGRLKVYTKAGQTLLAFPDNAFDQPLLWYAEIVGAPPGLVTPNLESANKVVRFERQGKRVLIRDLTGRLKRRNDEMPPGDPPEAFDHHPSRMDLALDLSNTGPVLATLPILTETQGSTVLDLSKLFASEIPGFNARRFAALTGLSPAGVDPERSYIERVRVYQDQLNIHSHLTFLAANPKAPSSGVQPVSLVIGYSLIFLPISPMSKRHFDSRVGYFTNQYFEYEASTGAAMAPQTLINRFRLEKKDKKALISDPIKPIVFYIGPGVPDRWRLAVKAGVEQWLPVFKAAGFSNAIKVLDAPTAKQDPNWSADNLGINVIRWLPQEYTNAYGPHVIDPRSGETLSAHIVIWPSVIDYFAKYYYVLFSSVDPEAAHYPLSEKKMNQLMSYIVAHEVGHTLGLRHNHLASTAYSVSQLRQPDFANQHGPNSSIMAYGRFNQAAQPGDDVMRLYGVIGPYDLAAIKWGYGDFSQHPGGERQGLDALAATFTRDRKLFWGAGELPNEVAQLSFDPRLQTENVGAERIEASRLGIKNILSTVNKLEQIPTSDQRLFRELYTIALERHLTFLASTAALVGGTLTDPADLAKVETIPALEQQRAVDYLLGEGLQSLSLYFEPRFLNRYAPLGGSQDLEKRIAALVPKLLNGQVFAILDQQANGPQAYQCAQLGQDVASRIWGELGTITPLQKILQRAYLNHSFKLVKNWSQALETESAVAVLLNKNQGYPAPFALLLAESGDSTSYLPWLRVYLPQLKLRLDEALKQTNFQEQQLHLSQMSHQTAQLIKKLIS